MKQIITTILLLLLTVSANAGSHPVGFYNVEHSDYVDTDKKTLTTETLYISLNNTAKKSDPFTLRYRYSTESGEVIYENEQNEGEDNRKAEVRVCRVYLPANTMHLNRAANIVFTCELVYNGRVIDTTSKTFPLKVREATLENLNMYCGETQCRLYYSIDKLTFSSPHVVLMLNGKEYQGEVSKNLVLKREELRQYIGDSDGFDWQMLIVDPLNNDTVYSSAVQHCSFAPMEISCHSVTYSNTKSELNVRVHGIEAHNMEGLRYKTVWAGLYDDSGLIEYVENTGNRISAGAYSKNYVTEGLNGDINITIPLKTVSIKYGSSFSGKLIVMFYDSNQNHFITLKTEPIKIDGMNIYRADALFRSECPEVCQHNGPVIVHLTLSGARLMKDWIDKIYVPNHEMWRQKYGATILYHNFKSDRPSEGQKEFDKYFDRIFADAKPISETLVKELKKLPKVATPAVFVFDGHGNCIYYKVGFVNSDQAIAEATEGIEHALKSARH